jgi:hypothetical protein
VAVDERHALAARGAGEPVAVLLLGAVAALVAFRAFAPAKTRRSSAFVSKTGGEGTDLLLFRLFSFGSRGSEGQRRFCYFREMVLLH